MGPKFDYTKADAALKENINILFSEFNKKYPKLLSATQFYARRAALKGKPYKGHDFKNIKVMQKKMENKPDQTPSKNPLTEKVEDIISRFKPSSSYQKEFRQIAPILMQDSLTPYTALVEKGVITMSNPDYYQFRKYFVKALNSGAQIVPKRAYHRKEVTGDTSTRVYRRNPLYRTVITKEQGTYPKEGVALLEEVLSMLSKIPDVLRQNVEVLEIENRGLEIRTFSKR